MSYRILILLILSFCLNACSIVAYSPVIMTAALGLNKEDLSNEEKYRPIISSAVRPNSPNTTLYLKKFSEGRYYLATNNSTYNRIICNLEDGHLIINEVFFDTINGGIFYAANVYCNQTQYQAPLNDWSDELLEFIPLATTEQNTGS
jgi:hypothetical protein